MRSIPLLRNGALSRVVEDLSAPSTVGDTTGEFLELGIENIGRKGKPESFREAYSADAEPNDETLNVRLCRLSSSSSMLDFRLLDESNADTEGIEGESGCGGII